MSLRLNSVLTDAAFDAALGWGATGHDPEQVARAARLAIAAIPVVIGNTPITRLGPFLNCCEGAAPVRQQVDPSMSPRAADQFGLLDDIEHEEGCEEGDCLGGDFES